MFLHISSNIDQLSISVADWMVKYIHDTLQKQEKFTLVLSGGNTPKKLNELLASDAYKNKIDWKKVHIFFGDERFVPFSDERNNAKLAFDTLLNYVPVAKENIHIMPTENIMPEIAATEYEKILHKYFTGKGKTFDLIFLGMGDDGHTLSLFPGKKNVINETAKWCVSLWLESQNMFRITLTHGIVNKSAAVAFLVSGNGKAKVLHEVLKGKYNPELYPSQIINPENGELHWFADEDAVSF